jgi:hypothetical protein
MKSGMCVILSGKNVKFLSVETGCIYAVSNSYPLTLNDLHLHLQMHLKILLEFHCLCIRQLGNLLHFEVMLCNLCFIFCKMTFN